MVTMYITLDEAIARELEKRAAELGQRPEDVAAELVRRSIEEDLRYRAAVREGIAAVEAGKVADFDDVFDRLEEKILQMKAKGSP